LDGGKGCRRDFILQILVVSVGGDRGGASFSEEGARIGLSLFETAGVVLGTTRTETFLQAREQNPVGPMAKLSIRESLALFLRDRKCGGLI